MHAIQLRISTGAMTDIDSFVKLVLPASFSAVTKPSAAMQSMEKGNGNYEIEISVLYSVLSSSVSLSIGIGGSGGSTGSTYAHA